jgi:hypothetical protein
MIGSGFGNEVENERTAEDERFEEAPPAGQGGAPLEKDAEPRDADAVAATQKRAMSPG